MEVANNLAYIYSKAVKVFCKVPSCGGTLVEHMTHNLKIKGSKVAAGPGI
jgi:hypothetical protein